MSKLKQAPPKKNAPHWFASFCSDQRLENILSGEFPHIAGVHRGVASPLVAAMFLKSIGQNRPLMAVFHSDAEAFRFYEEARYILKEIADHPESHPFVNQTGSLTKANRLQTLEPLYLPSWGILPFTFSRPAREKEGYRARALSSLIRDDAPRLLATSIEALSLRIPKPSYQANLALEIQTGQEFSFSDLSRYLEQHEYERVDIVNNYGQFSIKGNVVDLFAPSHDDPVRIDFFGDEVETIQLFDPNTQRSYRELNSTTLFPARDLVLSQVQPGQADDLHEDLKKQDLAIPPFLSGSDPSGFWDLYPEFFETGQMSDYFSSPPLVVFFEPHQIWSQAQNLDQERIFLYEKNSERAVSLPEKLFFSAEELESEYQKNNITVMNLYSVPRGSREEYPEYDARFPMPAEYKGRINRFVEEWSSSSPEKEDTLAVTPKAPGATGSGDHDLYISASTGTQLERIEHILSAYGEFSAGVTSFLSPLRRGFLWNPSAGSGNKPGKKEPKDAIAALFTEHELFGKSTKIQRIKKSATQIIGSFTDLKNGDYVVHINYGIGRFLTLKRMSVAGAERDFLELEYAGSDKLYVPLEQLNLVHKYIGSSDHPRIDFLGKRSSWEKSREKARESAEKTAAELLELYAKREKAVGYAYPVDGRFQEQFEASFPFEETDHQIATINEVKKDMESDKPMDRLICGDVGFGKTEVAIRAAFKAVMAGKQVSVLCPTTVLAFQHYNTFQSRFENYAVTVDYVSRFRTASEIAAIKSKAAAGKIDIIIGTHALLSPAYQWKNLGLLVIDEEQKFGVAHKEKIKQLKHNIDSIAMTATPIPRTLQMSLIGIRDLSIIETPPRNRKKIETYVIEENDSVLHNALKHEVERGGQVFILHNRVQTIEAQAKRILSIYPKARLVILHGQLSEHEIERRMLDFYRQHYDIMLSTTIIESGVDIPNANTLIVMGAHKFGLSQLYQIKGRVGRSDRQAYAYFFYPAQMAVNEIAQKRLNTLMEHDGLGDGFKIAMKDLEIRGAGNLLGKEQSGDIMTIGFELYVRMLSEKIAELRNEEVEEPFECLIQTDVDFYLPDEYIEGVRQKMEVYKKMAAAQTPQDIDELSEEIRDRFGKPPAILEAMLLQEKLRVYGNLLKLEKINVNGANASLAASPRTELSMEKMMKLIQNDQRFHPDASNPKNINYRSSKASGEAASTMKELCSVLEYLAG